jgi:hypothetical protein
MSHAGRFGALMGRSWRRIVAAVIALQVVGIALVVVLERRARLAEEAGMSFKLRPDVWWVENPAKGTLRPPIIRAAESTLKPDDYVIGVEAGGKARAYRLTAFDDASGHIVNDLIGDVPVSVTYCNISHCVRVYTDSDSHEPLDAEVVGLMNSQMIVKLGGVPYFHETGQPVEPDKNPSPIPYSLIAPALTTWKTWKQQHPETEVFEGKPTAVAQEPGRWLNNTAKATVRPRTRTAEEATLPPSEPVIGVEIGGKARAYRVAAFDDASGHLVNDLIGDLPVSVAYSNVSHSARVYADDHGREPMDVEVAGLRNGEMIIKLRNTIYFHETGRPVEPAGNPPPIPYRPVTPVLTSWDQWRRSHPATDVFEGGRGDGRAGSHSANLDKRRERQRDHFNETAR